MEKPDVDWEITSQIEKFELDPRDYDPPELVVDEAVVEQYGDGEQLILTPETMEELGELARPNPKSIDQLASWVGTPDDTAPRADERPSQLRSPEAIREEIETIRQSGQFQEDVSPSTGTFPDKQPREEMIPEGVDLAALDKNPYPVLADAIEGYLFFDSADFREWNKRSTGGLTSGSRKSRSVFSTCSSSGKTRPSASRGTCP